MPARKQAQEEVPVEDQDITSTGDDGTRPSHPENEPVFGELIEGVFEPEGVHAAMVAAQKEIGNIAKTALNPHFKSKFVDLATATETIIPVLNKHNLYVIQGVHVNPQGTPTLDTTIYHEDGSSVGHFSYPLVSKDMTDPQKVGASMTYARRYSLMAIVGAAPEDDDGNTAATPAPIKKVQTPRTTIGRALKSAGVSDPQSFKDAAKAQGMNVSSFDDLSDAQVSEWLEKLDTNASDVPF